jgi:hypothetical protein
MPTLVQLANLSSLKILIVNNIRLYNIFSLIFISFQINNY